MKENEASWTLVEGVWIFAGISGGRTANHSSRVYWSEAPMCLRGVYSPMALGEMSDAQVVEMVSHVEPIGWALDEITAKHYLTVGKQRKQSAKA